jgi:hypothetical protein
VKILFFFKHRQEIYSAEIVWGGRLYLVDYQTKMQNGWMKIKINPEPAGCFTLLTNVQTKAT